MQWEWARRSGKLPGGARTWAETAAGKTGVGHMKPSSPPPLTDSFQDFMIFHLQPNHAWKVAPRQAGGGVRTLAGSLAPGMASVCQEEWRREEGQFTGAKEKAQACALPAVWSGLRESWKTVSAPFLLPLPTTSLGDTYFLDSFHR